MRLEQAQLLLLPVLVGLVGMLHANLGGGRTAPNQFHVVAAFLAILAPLVVGLVVSWLWREADVLLLGLAAMLTSLSVVLLYTSGREAPVAVAFYQGLALRQSVFVVAGYVMLLFGISVAHRIDIIGKFPYTMAFGGLLLTTTTIVLGTSVNGARLWLELGPLRFQPGEVSRLLLTTFIAIYLFGKRHHLAGSWRAAGVAMPAAPHLVPLGVGVLLAVAALSWQNDLGMAAAIGLVAACFAAGAMWSRIGAALTFGTVVLAVGFAAVAAPRVRTRAELWLDPWSSPSSSGYQFVQSDFALTAGGISGARSLEAAARVPEFQTDFVLIALGSRFGLGVAVATICLISLLVVRCIVASLRARSDLGSYVGIGIALMLGIQSILIIGGTLRLLPLTGLTVPLVSYGGTSMLVTLFSVGVVMGLGAAPRRGTNATLRVANRSLHMRTSAPPGMHEPV